MGSLCDESSGFKLSSFKRLLRLRVVIVRGQLSLTSPDPARALDPSLALTFVACPLSLGGDEKDLSGHGDEAVFET